MNILKVEKQGEWLQCDKCHGACKELFQPENEQMLCSHCMLELGLCQVCGEYIPFPEDENDELNDLSESTTNYTPTHCLTCKTHIDEHTT